MADVPFFYKLSYLFYTLIGAILAMVIGIMVSCITGGSNKQNPLLYAPIINKFRTLEKPKNQTKVNY